MDSLEKPYPNDEECARSGSSEEEVVVHNTFLEVKPKKSKTRTLTRCHSDSESHASRSSTSSFSDFFAEERRQQRLALSSFMPLGMGSRRELDKDTASHRDDADSNSHDESAGSSASLFMLEAINAGQGQVAAEGQPSLGSLAHEQGKCKPCFKITSAEGCTKGFSCEFCHLEHQRKTRRRPCKAKRDQCKRLVAMVGEDALKAYAADGHRPDITCQPGEVSSGLAYLNNLLRGPQGKAERADASPGGNAKSAACSKMQL